MQTYVWVIIVLVLVGLGAWWYMDKKKKDEHQACIAFGKGCSDSEPFASLGLCRQYLPSEQCLGYVNGDQFDCTAAVAACNKAHPQ
jgi:hypothetical protein